MSAPIRVLVVEDSTTVRKRLVEVLTAAPGFEVVAEAADGKSAIDLCKALRPDVITLDMMLPVMTGLAATEQIMAYFPTPILIVSASTNRGELFRTYEALAAGAVDVLDKPRAEEPDEDWERRLVSAVRMVARIRVITHPRARFVSFPPPAGAPMPRELPTRTASSSATRVVALGASTGGPGTLVEILRAIPAPASLPILIVLHIGARFSEAFADWLDDQTPHRVSFARGGEPVTALAGRVVIAPPERHLLVQDGVLRLSSQPERHSCRPSVDVLFESIAQEYGAATVACLLTGMGRDGASGLLAIKRAGGHTIAQDEATSIVYGMPREAVLLGAVDRVLSVTDIGHSLARLMAPRAGVAP